MKQTKKTTEMMKLRAGSSKDKIDTPLARLTSLNGEKTQTTKVEMKEMLQLTPQKYKRSQETTTGNCQPTNCTQKKWMNPKNTQPPKSEA